MPAPKLDASKIAHIREVYSRTGNISQTAAECNVSPNGVRGYVRDITPRRVRGKAPTKLGPRQRAEIHRRVQAGETHRAIADATGLHPQTVAKAAREPLPEQVPAADGTPQLPESFSLDYQPFGMAVTGKTLLISDVHIPFHDRRAVEAAVKHGRDAGVKAVLVNGDALDFHGVSRFDHDGTAITYQQEIEYGRKFFAYLRGQFPRARIVFKEGNHEERLERYILTRAPALFGLAGVNVASLVELENHGVEHVGEQRVIRLGKLSVIHGHEYGRGTNAPVNAARWLMLRARRPAIMGHLHHTSEQRETAIDDTTLATWSIGCLCGLHPRYARLTARWGHGWAIVDVAGDGSFEVDNRSLVEKRVA
jgi:predicted phosphodiesterase